MTGDDATPPPERRRPFHHWFRDRFGNPSAVYGLIVYSVVIATASDDTTAMPEILLTSIGSLLVFFVAHVFAHTLADHGRLPLGAAIAHGVRHSVGMLYSAIPSTLVLVAGLSESFDDDTAAEISLLVAMVVLGLLGYSAYAERGVRRTTRWIGAIGTALLGFVIIMLDYFAHSHFHVH